MNIFTVLSFAFHQPETLQKGNGCENPPCSAAWVCMNFTFKKWVYIQIIFFKVTTSTKWVFPKIRGKPPKWMVKIMENPIKMGWFGGTTSPLFLVQHPNKWYTSGMYYLTWVMTCYLLDTSRAVGFPRVFTMESRCPKPMVSGIWRVLSTTSSCVLSAVFFVYSYYVWCFRSFRGHRKDV